MRRERWAGALFAAAGLLVACGDDEPAASSSTTVEATGSTSTTAVPSTEATGTEGPVTFESAHYPVALRLPAGVEDGSWVDARRPWDGVQGIDMAGPFVDVVFLPSRSLFFFGTDTSDDLEAFVATVAGSATRRHQCTEPQNRRDVVVAEIPAVAYSQTCELDAVFARVALVHDGFGLVVFSPTIVGQEVAALDEIISSLDGLELRTS